MAVKPFIKWVGGKTQLLQEIRKHYPVRIDKYCEPFVGGGAVLFDVLWTFKPNEVLINDINPELINAYQQVKNNTNELIKALKIYENEYFSTNDKRQYYILMRTRFNELITSQSNTVEKAALFIALNKTCFNGLYRVNSKGLFNVPSNGSNHPMICDKANIRMCGELLKNTVITLGDYKETANFIDKNTFIYVDPPYRPLTVSSSFTSYNENRFTDENQIELGQFLHNMSHKGASVLLSNSDPKNTNEKDNFFDELYKDFTIERVKASRMINSKGTGRGAINELLISNSHREMEEKNNEERFQKMA